MPHDAFDLLGLPARFDLDSRRVEQAYLDRVAHVHPDASIHGQDQTYPDTSILNRARSDLLNPERRAQILLSRHAGGPEEDPRGLPEGLLPKMMSINLQLEEAIDAGDSARVRETRSWAETRQAQCLEEITRCFEVLAAGNDATPIRTIRVELNVLRYVVRLLERLESADAADDAPSPR
ncbi:MAG: hypothetical protein H6811_10235 [Phycisphaeraceae bacterium]|nr:hypothetical protein [Phycisphaeraceae bacterium]